MMRKEFFNVWRRKNGLLASPGEKDSSVQGPARDRRVWLLRSTAFGTTDEDRGGSLVFVQLSGKKSTLRKRYRC